MDFAPGEREREREREPDLWDFRLEMEYVPLRRLSLEEEWRREWECERWPDLCEMTEAASSKRPILKWLWGSFYIVYLVYCVGVCICV